MAFGVEVEHDGVAVVKASFVESGDVNVTQVADAEGVATARFVLGNDEAEAVRAEVEEVAARVHSWISGELGTKFSVHG